MNRIRSRRAPPLWILLDVLMLWVLALLSVPMEERGISYKFLGLPLGSVLFQIEQPLRTDQQKWTFFDFDANTWRTDEKTTPHGRENFICDECEEFLPEEVKKPAHLMIGLPAEMRNKIHEAFFEACGARDCAPTLYIDGNGDVVYRPKLEISEAK